MYVTNIYSATKNRVRGMVMVFSATLSFIGGGNRNTRTIPPTCRKSLTNFITNCCFEYISPWAGFELTTFVMIDTDYIGICKSNYHMITTMTTLTKNKESQNIDIYIRK